MTKKITALVPMKGHSERVPNKNIKQIAGKPLCRWILETLLKTPLIESIIINTDSSKIASICSFNKRIKIHKRPKQLRGDTVSMNKIINCDIKQLEGEHYLQTHATNPLLKPETIQDAITTYFDSLKDFDSLFSVTKLQTRLYGHNYKPLNHDPGNLVRTQDLKPLYEENSNIYIFSKKSFKKTFNRIGNNPRLFKTDKLEATDIDEYSDFVLAKKLLQMRSSEKA